MTTIVKPYYLFGGPGHIYLSAHFSLDEAQAAAVDTLPWSVYVYQDEGLVKVAESQPEPAPTRRGRG